MSHLTRFDIPFMRHLLLSVIVVGSLLIPAFGQTGPRYAIVPRPARLDARPGDFTLTQTTLLLVPPGRADLRTLADELAAQLRKASGFGLPVQVGAMPIAGASGVIRFGLVGGLGTEAYRIDVTPTGILLEASQPAGFFYAVQSLLQLLPADALGDTTRPAADWRVPACRIEDQPRFPYRGLMLDVSRHFWPVPVVKRWLDLMAMHKLNTFHWHLTDDQGWRIEIKKYPKLTQIGSQRRETIVGHFDDFDPQVFDGKPYGGFYTQAEVREVVRYAAAKHITVVPEIEMPGHALAALAAYPELSCDPSRQYDVATKWGVFEDVFCPTEKTFAFLQDVLMEVMTLFPGKYIHIGGDECPKKAWEASAFCQQLMKREGLRTEHELQSYFIRRIDKFVTAKGRRIIGWDEILEGGLSPNATVMSWRGIKGGITAARQNHDVVMTPGSFVYLDHYQSDPGQEPLAFGGNNNMAKLYGYDPTPDSLTPDQARHILGAQANLWTEYIATTDQLEYMVWPRAAALAEVVWTARDRRDYDDFTNRLASGHLARLRAMNVNHARSLFDVTTAAQPTAKGTVAVRLTAGKQVPTIRYTTDGSPPTDQSPVYDQPVMLERTSILKAVAFADVRPLSRVTAKEYVVSKATGKPYTLLNAPGSGRPDRGQLLTNGVTASMGGYELADVVSFQATDLSATIDLGTVQSVSRVTVGVVKYTARNLCLPRQIEVSVSDDGRTFRTAGTLKTNAAEGGRRGIVRLAVPFAPMSARYVRVVAQNADRVPAGLRNPGKVAQLAVDEITVD